MSNNQLLVTKIKSWKNHQGGRENRSVQGSRPTVRSIPMLSKTWNSPWECPRFLCKTVADLS